MAFQPVPLTARVDFVTRYNNGDREFLNTLYFRKLTAWDQASIATLTDNGHTSFNTNMRPFLPEAATLIRVVGRDLSQENGFQATNETDITGLQAPPQSSANNAFVCNFIGAPAGQPARGRIFWPFMHETFVDDLGRIPAAVNTDLTNAIAAWANATTGTVALDHVIVSRFDNGVKRTTAVTNDVQSYVGRPVVGSQRDRRTRIGL